MNSQQRRCLLVGAVIVALAGGVNAKAPNALPVIPAGLNKDYTLAVKPSQSVSAVYTYDVKAPRLKAKEWLIFAAKPVDLPSQRVISLNCTPHIKSISDLSEQQRPLLLARVPVTGA